MHIPSRVPQPWVIAGLLSLMLLPSAAAPRAAGQPALDPASEEAIRQAQKLLQQSGGDTGKLVESLRQAQRDAGALKLTPEQQSQLNDLANRKSGLPADHAEPKRAAPDLARP